MQEETGMDVAVGDLLYRCGAEPSERNAHAAHPMRLMATPFAGYGSCPWRSVRSTALAAETTGGGRGGI